MRPHFKKDTNRDAGTKEGKQTAFSCPPTSPAFSKELQNRSCLRFNYSCTLVIVIFSVFVVSHARKKQLRSTREQPPQLFLFKGRPNLKKRTKRNSASCGEEMGTTVVMDDDAKSFSRSKVCKLLFSSTVGVPDVQQHTFFSPFFSFGVVYFCFSAKCRLFLSHQLFIYLVSY